MESVNLELQTVIRLSYLFTCVLLVRSTGYIPEPNIGLAELPYLFANATYIKEVSFDMTNDSIAQSEIIVDFSARLGTDNLQLLNNTDSTHTCGIAESDYIPARVRNARFEIHLSVNYPTTNTTNAWFGFLLTNATMRWDCVTVAYADLYGVMFWQKLMPFGPIFGVYQNETMLPYQVPGPTSVVSEADCNFLLTESGSAEYDLVFHLTNDSMSVYMTLLTSQYAVFTCITDYKVPDIGDILATGTSFYGIVGMKSELGSVRISKLRAFALSASDPTTTSSTTTTTTVAPATQAPGNTQQTQRPVTTTTSGGSNGGSGANAGGSNAVGSGSQGSGSSGDDGGSNGAIIGGAAGGGAVVVIAAVVGVVLYLRHKNKSSVEDLKPALALSESVRSLSEDMKRISTAHIYSAARKTDPDWAPTYNPELEKISTRKKI